MASFSVRCCLLNAGYELKTGTVKRAAGSSICFPCHGKDPEKKENMNQNVKRMAAAKSFGAVVEMVRKGVRESLSPKQKGDWKDVVLMSISFAVYVYMAQKIVCAYCLWLSMPK